MISELLTLSVLVGIATSGVRLATPYLFAALGETFAQRSGVLNLGVDGMMLMGAFMAFFVVFNTESLWLGVAAALLVGALMGLLMAVVSVTLKAEQGISGIGLYLFGLGLSSLLFKMLIGSVESVSGFANLAIPGLSQIPIIGPIFFNQNALTYADHILIPVSCDYLSLVGVKQILRTLKKVNELLLHPVSILGVVPTFYDVRTRISVEAVNTLKSYFKDRVLPPIRVNTRLKEAPSHKKTIFEYAPDSRGSKDYRQLVKRVISLCEANPTHDEEEAAVGRPGA